MADTAQTKLYGVFVFLFFQNVALWTKTMRIITDVVEIFGRKRFMYDLPKES